MVVLMFYVHSISYISKLFQIQVFQNIMVCSTFNSINPILYIQVNTHTKTKVLNYNFFILASKDSGLHVSL